MKKKFVIKFVSIVLSAGILFASCASSTLIQSYPTGAKVYIDGQAVGVTPYWHTDTKIVGSVTDVNLVKEGYEPLNTSFMRNERVDVGAIIGGLFLWVPYLWTMQYNPTHNYEMLATMQKPQKQTPETVNQNKTEIQSEPQVSSKVQRMRELKQLLDEKLISTQDFEKLKQKILEDNE